MSIANHISNSSSYGCGLIYMPTLPLLQHCFYRSCMITNLPVKNLFNINGSGDQCNQSFSNNGFPPECWDLLHRLFINVFHFFFFFFSVFTLLLITWEVHSSLRRIFPNVRVIAFTLLIGFGYSQKTKL